jgi:hypothetical protein
MTQLQGTTRSAGTLGRNGSGLLAHHSSSKVAVTRSIPRYRPCRSMTTLDEKPTENRVMIERLQHEGRSSPPLLDETLTMGSPIDGAHRSEHRWRPPKRAPDLSCVRPGDPLLVRPQHTEVRSGFARQRPSGLPPVQSRPAAWLEPRRVLTVPRVPLLSSTMCRRSSCPPKRAPSPAQDRVALCRFGQYPPKRAPASPTPDRVALCRFGQYPPKRAPASPTPDRVALCRVGWNRRLDAGPEGPQSVPRNPMSLHEVGPLEPAEASAAGTTHDSDPERSSSRHGSSRARERSVTRMSSRAVRFIGVATETTPHCRVGATLEGRASG